MPVELIMYLFGALVFLLWALNDLIDYGGPESWQLWVLGPPIAAIFWPVLLSIWVLQLLVNNKG